MIKKLLNVPNTQAEDYDIEGIIDYIDDDFIENLKKDKFCKKPLMICSGGTSSRCAAKEHITIDFRKNYTEIDYIDFKKEVVIQPGIRMQDLGKFLKTMT